MKVTFPLNDEQLDQVLSLLVEENSEKIEIDMQNSDLDEVLMFLTNLPKINSSVTFGEVSEDLRSRLVKSYLSQPFYDVPADNKEFWDLFTEEILLEKSDDESIKQLIEIGDELVLHLIHMTSCEYDSNYFKEDTLKEMGYNLKAPVINTHIQPLLYKKEFMLYLLNRSIQNPRSLSQDIYYFPNMDYIYCYGDYSPAVVMTYIMKYLNIDQAKVDNEISDN